MLGRDRYFTESTIRRRQPAGIYERHSFTGYFRRCLTYHLQRQPGKSHSAILRRGIYFFTLSQAGMAKHWYKERGPHWLRSAIVNGIGCVFTACALIVIAATKFTHGAWFVLILIPLCLYLFSRIHGHYKGLESKLSVQNLDSIPLLSISRKHKVVILVTDVDDKLTTAVPYARTLCQRRFFAIRKLCGT